MLLIVWLGGSCPAFSRGFKEVFGKPALIPTPLEERARLMDATAGELSRSLRSIDGVLDAHVHVVLGEKDPPTKPRASVLLITRHGTRLAKQAVQELVAGAVPELALQDVAVVFTEKPLQRPKHTPPNPNHDKLIPALGLALGLLGAALAVAAFRLTRLRKRLLQLQDH